MRKLLNELKANARKLALWALLLLCFAVVFAWLFIGPKDASPLLSVAATLVLVGAFIMGFATPEARRSLSPEEKAVLRLFKLAARKWTAWMVGRAGPTTVRQAEYWLDLLSALVPKRIANEEIGDALEAIHRMVKAKRPKWFIYLKVATTCFWVGVHTVMHYARESAAILKAGAGKSDKD